MGFLDQLRMNNVFNPGALNPYEPLFGGLIPRREILPEQTNRMPSQPQEVNGNNNIPSQNGPVIGVASPLHDLGLDKPAVNTGPPLFAGPDYKEEATQLARDKQRFEEEKFGREQGFKENLDTDKQDIEHR